MADKIGQSKQIGPGLYLVNQGFVCLYVLEVPSGLVAFDAGMKAAAVAAGFAKLGLDPAKVTHVFLTHSDTDHVGGLGAFPNAHVYLPEEEVAMIERRVARFFGFVYNRPLRVAYEIVRDGQELTVGDGAGAGSAAGARGLGGTAGPGGAASAGGSGATDRGGARIRCLSTPGHTAGSMSYLVNGSILIVGDELNLKDGKAVLDRGMIAVDNAKRRESIAKLAQLRGVTHLCAMHSGYTTDFEGAIASWRA